MKRLKKIPTFKDEDAERQFWVSEDSTEYIDWSQAETLFVPNLRRTDGPKQERVKKGSQNAPFGGKRNA